MRIDGNGGGKPNYAPNSYGGPEAKPGAHEQPIALRGVTGRTPYPAVDRADDFEQAGLLWRVMRPDEQARLVANLAGHLGQASTEIQQRQLEHFRRADAAYGAAVARALVR